MPLLLFVTFGKAAVLGARAFTGLLDDEAVCTEIGARPGLVLGKTGKRCGKSAGPFEGAECVSISCSTLCLVKLIGAGAIAPGAMGTLAGLGLGKGVAIPTLWARLCVDNASNIKTVGAILCIDESIPA